jgi:hypothetical protein
MLVCVCVCVLTQRRTEEELLKLRQEQKTNKVPAYLRRYSGTVSTLTRNGVIDLNNPKVSS